MIVGIGIDLLETARLARALDRHGERFERRVFTEREREECAGRGDRIHALAARFAAKEACMKALGSGWSGGVGFDQIEVARAANGSPTLVLHGAARALAAELGVSGAHVSLTHERSVAAAVVVLESEP